MLLVELTTRLKASPAATDSATSLICSCWSLFFG